LRFCLQSRLLRTCTQHTRECRANTWTANHTCCPSLQVHLFFLYFC
jgi:hypothetical protein